MFQKNKITKGQVINLTPHPEEEFTVIQRCDAPSEYVELSAEKVAMPVLSTHQPPMWVHVVWVTFLSTHQPLTWVHVAWVIALSKHQPPMWVHVAWVIVLSTHQPPTWVYVA